MTRQLQFESAKLDQHESLEQNQRSTLLCHSHESDQARHLSESNHAHSLHAFSQTMGSVHCLAASQAICPLNMMVSFKFSIQHSLNHLFASDWALYTFVEL